MFMQGSSLVIKNWIFIKYDRIVGSFKKADLSEEDWDEIDDTVKQAEIKLDDMLVQYSKVMEGYSMPEREYKNVKEKSQKVILFKD